jgi:hypothetical protein
MTLENTMTEKGIYKLYQHASVNTKTEFLKHLELKQNVVFVASLSDQIEMNKLCASAVLATIPFNDGSKLAHFQFTFNKLSDDTIKQIFYSVIDHTETTNNIPKYNNSKAKLRARVDNKIININIWRIDVLPMFQIEIY